MSAPIPHHRIGDAARRSGVTAANIRYYEKEGLLPAGVRADNSYRLYSDTDVHRLRFIRLCRAMDMSLDEVRSLLSLDLRSKADCDAACTTIDAHLHHVRERLQELQAPPQPAASSQSEVVGTPMERQPLGRRPWFIALTATLALTVAGGIATAVALGLRQPVPPGDATVIDISQSSLRIRF